MFSLKELRFYGTGGLGPGTGYGAQGAGIG